MAISIPRRTCAWSRHDQGTFVWALPSSYWLSASREWVENECGQHVLGDACRCCNGRRRKRNFSENGMCCVMAKECCKRRTEKEEAKNDCRQRKGAREWATAQKTSECVVRKEGWDGHQSSGRSQRPPQEGGRGRRKTEGAPRPWIEGPGLACVPRFSSAQVPDTTSTPCYGTFRWPRARLVGVCDKS